VTGRPVVHSGGGRRSNAGGRWHHGAVTVTATGLRGRVTSTDVFCVVLVVAVLARLMFGDLFTAPAVAAWTTVFAAICIQATPYLVLGVLLSTAIAVFVPPSFFTRVLPAGASLAVPVAGLAGAALPGCECGSVPVAASLMRRGVAPGPAVAFLLSAPATNPVVLVATAVAFPGRPGMVFARLAASLATALTVGWVWQRLGRDLPVPARVSAPEGASGWHRAQLTASHDLAQALGLLTIGAASAALLNVTLPRSWLDHLVGNEVVGIVALALLAIVLAVCSEADAFIAASLTQFSLTARLAFMVVGPAVDVKLIAMQVGTFGRGFAVRFAPLALGVAVVAAAIAGTVLL
jgi:uncharacterized membrane protein YraQ (UPF0718 family)